ncbi:penicillin-binding protein 1C [Azonexus sp.]|uniref:penicillin-binding protein 1C n=1 Tax=Azonexus sp. TaxID=1872668 RepID=UPI00282F456D|nr:penicillin-binding protein 1C [Azonexus sp.]MDR1996519.1 penicillin-binding protein 1C [Azonexus sp.]
MNPPSGRLRRWLWIALLALVCLAALDRAFPPPVPGRDAPQALLVVARDGTPLRAFPDRDHVWRHPVALADVSPLYLQALQGYEDRWFRWHPGVNPVALARAAWQWVRYGRIVSGGSTLTMQVARIIEPTPRTLAGKARQILRALQLEWRYSKDEILALYVNYAPMGGVLEGVEAASRAYLGKPARRLSHADAALLTVLPQAPSRLRPDRRPAEARAARDKVLQRMTGLWSDSDIGDARQEPIVAQAVREPLLAPLLAERLRREAKGEQRIDTTIDASMQETVELLLASRLGALPPRVSMATLVVDNTTLEVRAYAGSADFADADRFAFVDMVRAARSPGSTLKPFLYGLALDEGLIHSESLLADVPQSFGGYQPGNFQQSFHGPVGVSEALTKSLNVPAVEVLDRLEPNRFVAALRRGGLKLDFPKGEAPNLSVILGGAATTLEQLVGAYIAFARQGMAGKPRYRPGEPLVEQRMLSPGAAFIIRDVLESGGPIGRAVEQGSGIRRGIAWKTGTSFGFRDAWSVGVSDRYTVGVWVGRPDGTPNPGFFGANTAAPLLVDLFTAIDKEAPVPRIPPPSVRQEKICWPLGTRFDPAEEPLCHRQMLAWLLNDTAPPTFPDRLRGGEARTAYEVDAASGLRVSAECSDRPRRRVEAARWPAALEPWLPADIQARAKPPAWDARCPSAREPEAGLRIVGLSHGEVIRRPRPDQPPVIRLELRGQRGEVIWLINGRLVARQPASQPLIRRLEENGRVDITVMDERGRYDRISVSVR